MDEIKTGVKFEPYTSTTVIDELSRTQGLKRDLMLALIPQYAMDVIEPDTDVDRLASLYVREGIIPEKYRDDAVHIALATIAGIAIIVSWNFKHIVKHKTRKLVNAINMREGYGFIDICSPQEVIDDEDDV